MNPIRSLIVAAAFVVASFVSSAQTLTFIGNSNKNSLEYALGEEITFTVSLVDKDANNAPVAGLPLKWTLSGDDSSINKSGTATSATDPLTVKTSMSTPGFVRLKVEVEVGGKWLDGNTEFFDGGAGVDVMNISQKALPADFATFWQTETNRLYTTPYTVVCTNFNPSGAASGVVYKLFDITTFEGEKHATGILAMPEGADPKECGIIATFNGYGWGRTGLPNATDVKKGNIIIAVTRHGEDPVNDDPTYYDPTLKNEMGLDKSGAQKSYCWRNNDYTVQDTDFYKMLMRDLRAMQWAKSLPEWNGTALKTSGGSMGGYQAIGCASLDAAVTECNASIPWCSDLSGGVEYRYMTGWRPDWTANLDYVDLKNLATLMKCPVTFTAGLGDYVCPPSGEINLYKNLPTPKKATFTQNMGHGSTHGPSCSSYTLQDGSFDPPTPPPQPVVGRNLKWSWVDGNSNKKWSNPQNWKDTVGNTNAVPRSGDTLSLSSAGNPSLNDIEGLELKRFNIGEGGYQYQDQNNCKAITLRADSEGLYNTGYLYLDIPLIIEGTNMTISSTSSLVPRRGWRSYDDKPCGIVKIGNGTAGFSNINGGSAECAGFKYVELQEGNWAYGLNGQKHMHYLPTNQVFTFGAKNTGLWIGAPCVFTNFWLRETGTAVGKPHTIGNQNDNGKIYRGKLTICGTPPDDSTVFTGTFVTCADFCWSPDSSAKEFVVAGGNNTTTGDLEVANGTVRLTNGSTYSKLDKLTLSGGANTRLQLDTVPSVAFRGKLLTLATGREKISAPAGARLTFDRGTVGGARLLAGVYGAGGQSVDWIVGGGSVEILLDVAPTTLTWVGGHSDNVWNDPQNWTNPDGASDVPYACDQIVIVSSAGAIKVPAGTTLNCKTAYVDTRRLLAGTYGAGGTAVDWIVGGGSVVVAENIVATLTWTGNAGNKKWSDANNWTNTTTGQPDAPQDGDTLKLASAGDTQKNDIVGLKPYKIIPAGNNAYSNPGGNALIFEEGSWGVENGGYMYYMMPTVVRAKKITMYCSSSAGYTTGFYNDEGNEFEIDKTGGGLFAFKTGAGGSPNTFTGLKRINVLAGSLSFGWQGTGQMANFPAGMEVNFAASSTKLQFDQNTSFKDFCLVETGTAVGGSHSMGVQDGAKVITFTITGTPAVNPMVFTGDILNPLSFTWAPDTAASEFVLSGTTAKISTTKTITVTRGTMRLTGGATFKALGTLALSEGGVFAIDTQPDAFVVNQLTMASANDRLRLASGVVMSVTAATVNGQVLATGVYDGRGICGTKVDWIEGKGCLSVGGAPVVYPQEAETGVPMSWTANGGNDTSIGNGSNWGAAGSTALPDFAAGSLVATFGAGTGAQLDRRALFKGLNLAAPGAFAFTTAGSSAQAFLGSGGITTAGSGRTYDWAWPLYLMANQAWTVGATDVLNVNGNIGAINAEQLTLNGAGTVNFNASLDYDGQVNLRAGTINLNVDNALGSSATQPIAMDMSAAKIYFNGVTLNRTIRNTASTAGNNALYVKANTVNVLNGDLDVSPAVEGKINWGLDSTLRIKGHVKRATTAWFNFNGSGNATHRATLHLDSNTEIVNGSAFSTGSGMNLYFNAPSNQLGGVWFWFTGGNSTLYTTVPYAFAKTAGGQRSVVKCANANSEWNLCGCDQELAQFGAASPFRVTSDTPAMLHLATDSIYYSGDYCVTNTAVFKGGAGLSFDGTKYLHFGGVCDSTGTVQVTKGELRLLAAARWQNASAAVVKGGEMRVDSKNAFGKKTAVRFEGTAGTMNLAYTGSMAVKSLSVGGEELPEGVYGSAASGAPNVLDRLTGTGRLRVGQVGLYLLIR